MQTFQTIKPLKEFLDTQRSAGKSIGLVPTMGALHEGHISLLERANAENDLSACSIFVNPKQFNNPDDLEKYPRTVDKDLAGLENHGCDIVLVPSEKEIYPESDVTQYDFGHLDKVMEGKFRQGHFNGVAAVVRRLFEIFQPDRAYFGEKDFQQLVIIKTLVKNLGLNVEIVPCPIIREPDGLAMSSRNARLSERQRKIAPLIYKTLLEVKSMVKTLPIAEVCKYVTNKIDRQEGMELEYFEIVDMETLLPVSSLDDCAKCIACIAAYVGDIRLIDNMKL